MARIKRGEAAIAGLREWLESIAQNEQDEAHIVALDVLAKLDELERGA